MFILPYQRLKVTRLEKTKSTKPIWHSTHNWTYTLLVACICELRPPCFTQGLLLSCRETFITSNIDSYALDNLSVPCCTQKIGQLNWKWLSTVSSNTKTAGTSIVVEHMDLSDQTLLVKCLQFARRLLEISQNARHQMFVLSIIQSRLKVHLVGSDHLRKPIQLVSWLYLKLSCCAVLISWNGHVTSPKTIF